MGTKTVSGEKHDDPTSYGWPTLPLAAEGQALSLVFTPTTSVSGVVLDPNLGAGVMATSGKLERVEECWDKPRDCT